MNEQTQTVEEEKVAAAEETEAVEAAEVAGGQEAEEGQVVEKPSYEDLEARIAELEGQVKDEQLRGLANEQNLRRRHQQEIADTHKFAGQKFAAEMLPVKDYLEMALLDQSGNFDALKMGVQMTLNELQKAFDATQIKEINPQAGDKLDPHQHQAMQTVVSEQEPNTIVSVMKKGYTLSDRVLRPAMVVVAKKED
ncbi:nucleotide exchange factor GrpE [Neisseria animalis]|uniref:Protein GrpE n=1 Tax=Neisseria animalis TaxID=492 RepID=A0A5P3MUI9_NEIAN|nr:nucleotide exchange factor GrpE [Neisseria animalis]QEY24421.1 nucleotide exchange factor GrpE [Neisseria animalis]ROW31937.1 nucleotide exchange factor GrpE [Neisseria animalis]VEE07024.1 heat shock protein GrpE [Neisseria animalis]